MAVTKKPVSKTLAATASETSVKMPAPVEAPAPVETLVAPVETVIEPSDTPAAPRAEVAATAGAAADEMLKPLADIQEKFRASAEQGIAQLRNQYASLKGTAETATGKLGESVAAVQSGSREINLKVIELIREQSNAGFAHMQALFASKSIAQAVTLHQDFAKAQVQAFQTHAKALADIASKVTTSIVEPVKDTMALSFKR